MSAQRYDSFRDHPRMRQFPDGDYVTYADYVAERDALRAEVEGLRVLLRDIEPFVHIADTQTSCTQWRSDEFAALYLRIDAALSKEPTT